VVRLFIQPWKIKNQQIEKSIDYFIDEIVVEVVAVDSE